MMAPEDRAFQFLLDKIRRNKGMDFRLYREGTLRRRIERRMRATRCADYSEYIVHLNKEPSEYDRLVDAITINVTKFFRDTGTFDLIGKKVIPELVESKEKQGRRVIRVWSAGTSCGEEAYTVAILFLEVLKDDIRNFNVRIYGTDIDTTCIQKAREGIYEQRSVNKVRNELLQRYFAKVGERYKISEKAKMLTRFKVHNIICDDSLPNIDLILCRNVLIYFTRALQEMTYSRFTRALNNGGFLVMGKVESLWGYPAADFDIINNRERVYRKRSVGA